LGSLLRDEGGLALGQDENSGHKDKFVGLARQIGVRGQRLVERTLVVVGTIPPLAVGIDAEDVIVRQNVFVPRLLDPLCVVGERPRVVADLELR